MELVCKFKETLGKDSVPDELITLVMLILLMV